MKKFIVAIVLGFVCLCSCSDPYDIGEPITNIDFHGVQIYTSMGHANSVGGKPINCTVYNLSDKTIKYLSINTYCYNVFNDPVCCEIWDTPSKVCKLTGPINPGSKYTFSFGDLFYNTTAQKAHIAWVKLTFTDGSVYEWRD